MGVISFGGHIRPACTQGFTRSLKLCEECRFNSYVCVFFIPWGHVSNHAHIWAFVTSISHMVQILNSDWSRQNLLRSDWSGLIGAPYTTLACNCCKYSLLHLDQNSCARCCVRLHFLRQYKSSLLNSPGGGSRSLVFPVSSILADNGGSERGSLSVSTVRGLLLIVDSASQRNVLSDSSSRRLACSLIRPLMTFLIDLICLSHTPLKLLADAGFLIQSILA